MDDACDMVALPWVLRKAIAVLNYLEVGLALHRQLTMGSTAGLPGGDAAMLDLLLLVQASPWKKIWSYAIPVRCRTIPLGRCLWYAAWRCRLHKMKHHLKDFDHSPAPPACSWRTPTHTSRPTSRLGA